MDAVLFHTGSQHETIEAESRKHKITKTHADAATVTPLQDLLSCIFLSVYYLDPRLFIHRSLMKHRELRCILGGFYLMAGLFLMKLLMNRFSAYPKKVDQDPAGLQYNF